MSHLIIKYTTRILCVIFMHLLAVSCAAQPDAIEHVGKAYNKLSSYVITVLKLQSSDDIRCKEKVASGLGFSGKFASDKNKIEAFINNLNLQEGIAVRVEIINKNEELVVCFELKTEHIIVNRRCFFTYSEKGELVDYHTNTVQGPAKPSS